MTNWFDQLRAAKKTVTEDSLRTVIYEFENGKQLQEVYNLDLNVVTRRAWKIKTHVSEEWDLELGESLTYNDDLTFIKENQSEPSIRKRNTRRMIEWTIRNLPYPSETYSVSCNDKYSIVVKTTNKKYYKILKLPELERLGVPLRKENIEYKYSKNALCVKYIKQEELVKFDKDVLQMVKGLIPKKKWRDEDSESSDDEPVVKKRKIVEL